ncbi:MAG: glycosyltransferase family 2 protein [Bacteroidota bacterium]
MKISAVIITKNEARNIGRCLESLQGVADEVIVLDGQSTDGTQDICRQFGAQVVDQEWKGYARTKNIGNAMAAHPYVLSLDADEALSAELKAAMLAAKSNLKGVYSFNRLAFYCGKAIRYCGWYPDRKIRLFPKGGAEWQGDFVHEELVPKPDQSQTHLPGDLLHYTYYTVDEHRARARKYADLAAEAIARKKKGGLLFKVLFSPPWRFFQMYILKLGFLDGAAGFRICRITAQEVRWKYSKARKLRS